MRIKPALLLTWGILLPSAVGAGVQADTLSFRSPPHRMLVAELYTSEGCSSCPPADRWLSQELKNPLRKQQVLPLSFHVDYWDYIGWKDPYAKPQFTARQSRHKALGNTRVIYTPQYVFSGDEVREWRSAELLRTQIQSLSAQKPAVDIQLKIQSGSIDELELSVQTRWPNSAFQSGRAWVLVYEDGLTQAISAGENQGRTLRHDAVVRVLQGPFPVNPGNPMALGRVKLDKAWVLDQLGFGVFVENDSGTEIAQALNAPHALQSLRR